MRHTMLVGFTMALLSGIATAAPALAVEPALQAALQAPTRTPKFVARDASRHPAEELAFFGVKPASTVVEIWPGGGYWTQILAPYLHDHGTYYVAMGDPSSSDEAEAGFAMSPKFHQMLASDPAVYGNVKPTILASHHPDLAPPGSADVVLTFRNLHNWMNQGDAPEMLAAIRQALKPGGILGIEDHRANTRTPQDPTAASGYVRQDYATALVEKAGFKLVGSSEIDANPRDTADWPKGVWTLPPVLAMGQTDRAKYQAIGEADNFVLKFRKVGS
ncbi:class I SAM-dependent methyltransferase [Lichenicola sp.]|uniref:class I SAM-dependent methyltransferase n=1 Tax=Lichenicola sp. TaxID=2804529 RepID=UPI003B008418